MAPKRHLLVAKGRVACGVAVTRSTRQASEVTCQRCRNTIAMADAEIRQGKFRSEPKEQR